MKKLLLLAALCFPFAIPMSAQKVAVRAGHVVDPATGTAAADQVILVEDGRITAVGRNLDVRGVDRVIDLSDAWVMPGLMDAHVHLTLNMPDEMGVAVPLPTFYLSQSNASRALLGVKNARDVLHAGFTTVKDIGNDGNYVATDLRRAVEAGWIEGPTILNTGKIIGPFGGQTHDISPDMPHIWEFEYVDADSPEEVRKAVRQNIYYGATAIKLVADNSAFYYDVDEIRAAVDEAAKAGLTVAVHAYGGEGARNAILAGAHSIEHGWTLDDELLRLMKERGTVLVGTDFPLEHYRAMVMFFPDPEGIYAQTVRRLRRAHEIGVRMAFGSDVVVDLLDRDRGRLALDFLSTWVEAGVPAPEILRAFTTNNAEFLRVADERGAIAPGQWADLVATPGNPLQDILQLREIRYVMKEGRVVRSE